MSTNRTWYTASNGRKYQRNLLGAMRKGYEAFRDNKGLEACPYRDIRKWGGQITWSRSYIRAWEYGWRMAQGDQGRGDYAGWYNDRVTEEWRARTR